MNNTNSSDLLTHGEDRVSGVGMRATAILAYSVLAYFIGVAGLSLYIFGLAGLLPLGSLMVFSSNSALATLINIGLILFFGLQHSVMARPAFKAWSKKYLNPALERSNYVLGSGLAIMVVVLFWQPLPSLVWQASGNVAAVLWGLFAFGWLYMLAATFAINHFDLFGLRQAWFAAKGQEPAPITFKENWMYRFSRHPIMLGVMIGTWALPTMTVTSLMLAVGMSLYIAVGVYFEERDLIKQWGAQYTEYRQRVGALVTLFKR